MLAENPRPLGPETMTARIYSPFAYPIPRETPVVPVVVAEAERLAPSFPLVWRRAGEGREGEGPELVVLRTLLPGAAGFAPGTERVLALLPLVFQAYPFLAAPVADDDGARARLVDAAVPDEPNDAGASITGPDGRPSRGTELRLRALELLERDRARTAAISRAIAVQGLFEPWPLAFDLGHGRRCDIPDLLVVAPKAFDTPAIAPILAGFGVGAARLLALHRLSLFRAGALLSAAQGAVARSVRENAAQGNAA